MSWSAEDWLARLVGIKAGIPFASMAGKTPDEIRTLVEAVEGFDGASSYVDPEGATPITDVTPSTTTIDVNASHEIGDVVATLTPTGGDGAVGFAKISGSACLGISGNDVVLLSRVPYGSVGGNLTINVHAVDAGTSEEFTKLLTFSVVDSSPMTAIGNTSSTFAEDAAGPGDVVDTATITGGTGDLAWSLTADDSGNFAINAATGEISLVNGVAAGTHNITVKATDVTGQQITQAISYTVTAAAGGGGPSSGNTISSVYNDEDPAWAGVTDNGADIGDQNYGTIRFSGGNGPVTAEIIDAGGLDAYGFCFGATGGSSAIGDYVTHLTGPIAPGTYTPTIRLTDADGYQDFNVNYVFG